MQNPIWRDFFEMDEQPAGGPGMAGAPQGAAPQANVGPTPPQGGPDPSVTNPASQQQPQQPQTPDISQDPQTPNMPDAGGSPDFEQWKSEYMKQAIKGDPNVLIDLLNKVRDQDLEIHQDKFVSDNWQVQGIRINANVQKASSEIRKSLKDQIDQNNPSVSIVNAMSTVLDQMPELVQVYIRMSGTGGLKGELHRRYTAALLGAVQVGMGGNDPDLIYPEKAYSVKISTRFGADWGHFHVGAWALKSSDPQDYLEPPELKKLEGGSPGEREQLRLRVIMESISEQFLKRALIANVVGNDGTLYTLGWDVGTSLKAAYTDGKLIIKTRQVEGHPAMITPDGKIVPFMDVKIMYAKDSGEQDEDGKPDKDLQDFLAWRDGQLFLTASLDTIRDAANAFQGIVFKEVPYQGNPSDLKHLKRSNPGTQNMLFWQN